MNLEHRLQRWFKPRFAVIYPFGFFFLIFCFIDAVWFRTGIIFIAAGALLRLWANGYAIKNDKLTTSGPYAYVRNPLYLGTFLIAVGFVTLLRSAPAYWEYIAGALLLGGLCFVYYNTIKGEQGNLQQKFGNAFRDYCRHVPAMVPTPVAYTSGEKWPFSLHRLLHSKEHKPFFWIFILLVIFYLKTQVLLEHRPMNQTAWTLCGMALSLIFLDVLYEVNKKKFDH